MYKLHHIKEELGTSASTIYRQIEEGLFPAQVRTGKRSVGWPKAEFEEFKSQISTGLTTNEIRSLVASIHAKRNLIREAKK